MSSKPKSIKMADSASDQKLREGESSNPKPPSPERMIPAGTLVGANITNLPKVPGQPILTRRHPKYNKDAKESEMKKDLNFWSGITSGGDASKLDLIIQISTTDPAYDMNEFIRGIEYQGFDREFYIKHALTKMSVETFSKFAVIGALRGSNFNKIRETCENMPEFLINEFRRLEIVKTPKKRTDLTILRNTACIPHWCAYWMKKAKVTKKILKNECPAELQFPGAASLPMSREVRLKHLKFCADFSTLLPGGLFKVSIYATAASNLIPVGSIPPEILEVLQVKSDTEAYMLTDENYAPYDNSKSLVKTS